jgi:thioesterase domain-containing protein
MRLSPALLDFAPARAYKVLATFAANAMASRKYRASGVPCTVALFTSQHWRVIESNDIAGWRSALTGPVATYDVGGGHARMLMQPGLADVVRDAIRVLDGN